VSAASYMARSPSLNRGASRVRRAALAALLGVAALAASSPVLADEPGGAFRVETLVTVHRFTGDAPRADPDQPALRYGLYGLRWKAMAGEGVVLVAAVSDTLRLGLALDGFIELVNFDTGYPVPWESYRANIGFDLLAESPRLSRALLPPGGQLQLSLGWFHESDHAANVSGYVAEYLAPRGSLAEAVASFDNGDFSSYEYLKLRALIRQPLLRGRLTATAALGARLFPKAIDPASLRAMHAAVLAETRLTVRATEGVRPYASTYFELVGNGFSARESGFAVGAEREPLRYAIVNLGVDLVTSGGAIFSPFVTYSRSNGRGVDFPRFFGPEAGVGLAILP
jgi:hypothetical protein